MQCLAGLGEDAADLRVEPQATAAEVLRDGLVRPEVVLDGVVEEEPHRDVGDAGKEDEEATAEDNPCSPQRSGQGQNAYVRTYFYFQAEASIRIDQT